MFLGIEIGGTKLQAALGDGVGAIFHAHRVAAQPERGAEGIRRQVAEACRELLSQGKLKPGEIRGCAIGFGGPVDDRTGSTIISHQVAGWERFPLADWGRRELGLPTVIGNDADLAGLAEAHFGAGKGCDPVFYMNIGSGIGGTLVLGGRVHRGTGLGAGEVGHLWVDYKVDAQRWGPETHALNPPLSNAGEGSWSILEHRASGWAMQRAAGQPDVPALLRAIEDGDADALRVWSSARRRVALALSHVIALLCPQRIVLGGGVALAPERLLLQPLREELARIVFPPFAGAYDVQPAALGELVVAHGALALARQRFGG